MAAVTQHKAAPNQQGTWWSGPDSISSGLIPHPEEKEIHPSQPSLRETIGGGGSGGGGGNGGFAGQEGYLGLNA